MVSDRQPDRRGFCLTVIYGLGTLMGAALAVSAFLYLFFPPRVRKTSEWVDARNIGQLTIRQPQDLPFRRNRVDGWEVTSVRANAWVVKMSDTEVVAYSPWCTHLGCAYHWDPGKQGFLCPCHGSVFALDGKVLAGLAPRPLDRYEVKLEGGEIWLGPVRQA